MASRNITLIVRAVGARAAARQIDQAGASVQRLGNATQKTGKSIMTMGERMRHAGRAMSTTLTLPIVGVGVASVNAANSFQQSMTRIQTQAGLSKGLTDQLQKSILNMSDATKGPTELANAMFHIASVIGTRKGVNGAAEKAKVGMDLLKQSMHLASIGGADLEQTASALSAAYIVNMYDAKSLGAVTGILNATVGQGNMTMQGLVNAMGSGILPVAKQAGLGLLDVAGALATLTDEGWSASSAAHTLRTSFHFLTSPSDRARKAMDRIGLSTRKLALLMRRPGGKGLTSALAEVWSKLPKDTMGRLTPAADDVLGMIFPTGRGTPLRVLLGQLGTERKKVQAIARHGTAADANKQWATYLKTPGAKMQQAQASINKSLIQLGDDILPTVATMFQKVAGWVDKLADKWDKLTPKQKDTAVKIAAITAVVGPLMIALGGVITAIGGLAWVLGLFVGGAGRLLRLGRKMPGGTGGLGKRALGIFGQRGSSPSNPLWVAPVGGSLGVPGTPGKKTPNKVTQVAKKLAPLAVRAAPYAGPLAAIALQTWFWNQVGQHNFPAGPGGAARRREAAGGVPVDPGAPSRRSMNTADVYRPPRPRVPEPPRNLPNRVGEWHGDTVIPLHVELDGKQIGHSVHRAATRKQATR